MTEILIVIVSPSFGVFTYSKRLARKILRAENETILIWKCEISLTRHFYLVPRKPVTPDVLTSGVTWGAL